MKRGKFKRIASNRDLRYIICSALPSVNSKNIYGALYECSKNPAMQDRDCLLESAEKLSLSWRKVIRAKIFWLGEAFALLFCMGYYYQAAKWDGIVG